MVHSSYCTAGHYTLLLGEASLRIALLPEEQKYMTGFCKVSSCAAWINLVHSVDNEVLTVGVVLGGSPLLKGGSNIDPRLQDVPVLFCLKRVLHQKLMAAMGYCGLESGPIGLNKTCSHTHIKADMTPSRKVSLLQHKPAKQRLHDVSTTKPMCQGRLGQVRTLFYMISS